MVEEENTFVVLLIGEPVECLEPYCIPNPPLVVADEVESYVTSTTYGHLAHKSID